MQIYSIYCKDGLKPILLTCVILPEHIHMILHPENIKEYPQIISSIKHHFSANTNLKATDLTPSKIKKREKGIWHRRYFEHTITDEEDLNKHIDYIHYNPVKHKLVSHVKDWKYSTFHKFVDKNLYDINWGTSEQINSSSNLYED